MRAALCLSFGYDIWANLLTATVTKGDDVPGLSVGVNTYNRLTHPNVTYDAAGNMTNNGAGGTYAYDAENRMTSTAGVRYGYDGDGRRVKKSNGRLYWYGAGTEVLLETDLAGNNPDEYIFFASRRIARRKATGEVNYYFADHLGSSRVVTSATGQVLDDSDFYPFGAERVYVDALDNNYKFTGHERDPESALDYMKARYYSSSLGRFTSVDPSRKSINYADPQTWNRYNYSLNNPIRYVDRNGRWPTDIHNRTIDKAFPGLSEKQRDTLKTASKNVDRDQSTAGSFTHAMRAPNQTPEQAAKLANTYVEKNEAAAQAKQQNYEASGGKGVSDGAMQSFGAALHTVTDATSPEHEGFQEWKGTDSLGGLADAAEHVAGEMSISEEQLNKAVAAAQEAFRKTFGDKAADSATKPKEAQKESDERAVDPGKDKKP